MKNTILTLIGLTLTLIVTNLTNARSVIYYADLIADFNIINKQYSSEGYRLNNTLSRAELAKIATNLGGISIEKCTGNIYLDVKSSLGDLCGYIETLAKAKVISTSSQYFRPKDTVTRAETIKILLGVIGEGKSNIKAGYLDTSNLGDLEGYINKAKEIGSIADVNYIFPNAPILRHEVFVLAAFYAGMDTSTPAFSSTDNNDFTISEQYLVKTFDNYLLGRTWYDKNYLKYANNYPNEAEFIVKCDEIREIEITYTEVPDNLYSTIKNSNNPCQEGVSYGIYNKENPKGMYRNGDQYTAFSCDFNYDLEGYPTINTNGYTVTISDSEKESCSQIWLKEEGY